MSTSDWQETVYEAIDHDWAAQREFQAQLAEMLEDASEVRVVADDTDLRLSVEGIGALSDDGTENMPGGEVATVPVPGSVKGKVTFDVPITHHGRELEDARLVFEDGEVVGYSASRNEDLLTEILDTDERASRVGELGIGMNRGIDQPTGNVLFDEKMCDTVHVALGDALDDCVPEGKPTERHTHGFDCRRERGFTARTRRGGPPACGDVHLRGGRAVSDGHRKWRV